MRELSSDVDALSEVLALRPLTGDLVRRLNRELSVADLTDDLAETGYPSGPRGGPASACRGEVPPSAAMSHG
jgi:hypothetical protein